MVNPHGYNPVTPTIIEELKRICGADYVIFDNQKTLQKYSHDQIPEERYAHLPEVVVRPQSAAEIAGIMKLANREMIPVTPPT
jgi:glycolate oxidase